MNLKHFAAACAALLAAGAWCDPAAASSGTVRDGRDSTGAALYVVDRAGDGSSIVKPLLPTTMRTTAPALPLAASRAPAGDPVCGADAVAYEGQPMPAPETGTARMMRQPDDASSRNADLRHEVARAMKI